MSKRCKNFTYMNKSASELNLITVDFNNDDKIPMALKRTIVKGETNRYRLKANHLYATYDDSLEFEIHITKDVCKIQDQSALEFSRDEVREVTKWLTSSSIPSPMYIEESDSINVFYCGIFSNIEAFSVGGKVYGFIVTFTNDSAFAYSDEIVKKQSVAGYTTALIDNQSDLLDDYCYPVIKLTPKVKSDFILCNLSDSVILKEGSFSISGDSATKLNNFLDKINTFAMEHSYTVKYYYNGSFCKTWANDTAIRIKLIENDTTEHYCFAFYDTSGKYKIIEGGFTTIKLLKDLSITINCSLLTMYDDIKRMILFSDIGIDDEDYIYWLRLKNGLNDLILFADNCDVSITYREMLKVGAV